MLLSALLLTAISTAADSTLLRILSINDFHGRLDPQVHAWSEGRPIGGAPALKSAMDSAEARCRCPTLRLDAGDEMQGTLLSNLSFGRSTVLAFNRMGIQAAAVGNHDFDWSVDTLRARMRDASYAWLVANLVDSVSGRRPHWARPWRLLEAGDLRVAVIGLITRETKSIVRAGNLKGLTVRAGAAAIADVLAEVREQRPDLTILVAHAGASCDSLGCSGEIVELARELDSTQVQLIVSGHTHTRVNTQVNGIPIVQARSYSTALGVADLVRRADGTRFWRTEVETVWADRVTPDAGMAKVLEPFRARADSLAARRIAVLRDSLNVVQERELPLGNLLADAWRRMARADVGLTNNGGIRASLPAGPVSFGKLYEVVPFQNELVSVRIPGSVLREVIELHLNRIHASIHVSGVVVRWNPARPRGSRIVSLTLANGRPVRDATLYRLGTLDFLSTGISQLARLPQTGTGLTDVDALAKYLAGLPQPVAAPRTLRFVRVAQ
ncbi:MAG TPA: bifunctional UDP-sugar hydrolase/5'-nucleotidase [Gemmatimonadales bacterium]|jgi:5'-nucleotidase|nr:bifunctional UDP-sugar hydrolase/5'-nucleotidase [Gemmatimonadales bacterium]